MPRRLFTIFFLSLCFNLCAQDNVDSLLGIWLDKTTPDTIRIDAFYNYILKGILFTNVDSAEVLAQQLLAYGNEQEVGLAKSRGSKTLGLIYLVKGSYEESMDFFLKALEIEKAEGNRKDEAYTLHKIASLHHNLGNHLESLRCFKQSIAINEELGFELGVANSYNNMGLVFWVQGNNSRALELFSKSLKLYEKIDRLDESGSTLNNIGIIHRMAGNNIKALDYFQKSRDIHGQVGDVLNMSNNLANIADIHLENQNDSLALEYYNESLKIQQQLGAKLQIARTLVDMGNIYEKFGKVEKSLKYFNQSLEITNELGDKHGSSISNLSIGELYLKTGRFDLAKKYCLESFYKAKEIGSLSQQNKACECLFNVFKSTGQSSQALIYLEKNKDLEDSLKLEESAKKLEQLEFTKQIMADSLKQEKEKLKVQLAHEQEVRKKNRTQNIFLGSGLLFLLLAGGLYSRVRYIRKAKNLIEKEKDRSEYLLHNILPAEIARELKEKGMATAKQYDKVAILFTDFKGFTKLSEKLTASQLVTEINECFEAFDGICEKYKLEKIKTIGDSYMAAGGLPAPYKQATYNTVLAALEMMKFIEQRKSTKNATGELSFGMRAGVNTGPVVAGIVGVKKFQYDVWGDTVNTASRMESTSEEGRVNISQSTYDIIKDEPIFLFEPRGKVEAKGKGAIEMYFVSSIQKIPS